MSSEEFIAQLYKNVIRENIQIYKELFNNTQINQATDPYWQNALKFFGSLAEDQREVFFVIIRQIMVDTTSNILGVLDGVIDFGELDNNFHVYSGDAKEILNGNLQTLFLIKDEELTKF